MPPRRANSCNKPRPDEGHWRRSRHSCTRYNAGDLNEKPTHAFSAQRSCRWSLHSGDLCGSNLNEPQHAQWLHYPTSVPGSQFWIAVRWLRGVTSRSVDSPKPEDDQQEDCPESGYRRTASEVCVIDAIDLFFSSRSLPECCF